MEQLSAAPQRKERREVVCYECRASQRVSASADSTLCGNCGTWIDLRDVEVRERTTGRIRTRGDVTVHKKGALLGTAVHCGSLTLQGQFNGSVYAQETVTFRTGMQMLGEVRCRRLVVERRCGVRFLQPVHAEEIEILGEATGNFFVSGRAGVGRHGSLEGMLNTRLLRVDHGGAVNGPVMVEGAASRAEA